LFLAGKVKANANSQDKVQFAVFKCIFDWDKALLTWSDEKRIADICKTSSIHVAMLARALAKNGWKPSTLTLPKTERLNASDFSNWGLEAQ
jgi:hypothetical protein